MISNKMIFWSWSKLKVGRVYTQMVLTDKDCTSLGKQPFLVVREATKEEYEAQGQGFKKLYGSCYYYEIQTD
jgi:hypothetical protein